MLNVVIYTCPSTGSVRAYRLNNHLYGRLLNDIAAPAETVMLYEEGYHIGLPPGPHFGGYNVAYCDGHSKWQHSSGVGGHDLTGGPAPPP